MDEHPAMPRERFPQELIEFYGLAPLPREGGWYRRTWAGPQRPDGRPEGSAIVMLLTAEPGVFSALHRLPTDEIWHFYRGDPLTLLLLSEAGRTATVTATAEAGSGSGDSGNGGNGTGGGGAVARTVVLGSDVLGGQHVQFTVPAGTWMAAEVAEGGAWTLFGCTMAPGFTFEDYEHGDAGQLTARFPQETARIGALSRP
ncbi:cupin [Streptomyces albospinus]|uniref:Cupin n=1 Tax=Streptomyces albospinus TaxID=285515 RepID=A0ABQ2V1D2_9ACTN|nr:cupin domain-containing protein [Streptomyces albospinus]GGU64303.1 cupin [Streptomyces albospinus]